MTTITREEVKAFIEQIESDLSNGWEAQIFELKLARIALASLEAEPEPVVPESISVRQAISALESADCVTTIGQAYKMGWNACRAAMLQSKYRDLSQPVDPQISEYEKIMLQAGNYPVTPDGWISCSERMPEDEQEVIVHNKLGYRYVSYFDEHSGLFFDMRGGNQMNCIEHILVTHWMPLPAPPQK
ncbi:DUF551 domain-containing protein [Salmonella enterica subsp. enterica serovar Norwich]|uniref:DUF551 domain-containing protein n=2 Tax=Salmonella enterica TaxID=28901 RepID=A0A5T6JS11_SALER|nr:DUF551 domain-containing protein [Salmonella enterica]EBW0150183.1 DUF551 domain-containing protein [Salmonella enterica subsp. enterica serovar Norwich]EAM2407905.1 DUF551 domain-containing protein [Salmonella enterica]EAS6605651.1 DUF551 domain-containing protein [Salmonella enterica]EAU7277331.1 DUF551 domain-containing protein [Salmonella enterica]